MIYRLIISLSLCLVPASAAPDNAYQTSAEAYAAAKAAQARVAESDKCIADMHRRNNINNTRTLEDVSKLRKLYSDKKRALDDLSSGMYCSQCMRTKTEIEAGKESFDVHLRRVKGRPVPASAKQIADKAKEFDQKIKELRKQIQNNDTYQKLVQEYNVCTQKRQQAYNDYDFAVIVGNYLRGQEQWKATRERLKREQEARAKFLEASEARRAAEYERIRTQLAAENMRRLGQLDRSYRRENEESARKLESQLRQRLEQERQAAESARTALEEYNKWAYPPGSPDPGPADPGVNTQSSPSSVMYDVNEQLEKLLNAGTNAPGTATAKDDNVFRQVGQDNKPAFEILYQSPNWPVQYHQVVTFNGNGQSTSHSPPGSTWPPPGRSANNQSNANNIGNNNNANNGGGNTANNNSDGRGNNPSGNNNGGNSRVNGSTYYRGGGRSNPDTAYVFGYASSLSEQVAKMNAFNVCAVSGRNCELDRLIRSNPGYYSAIVYDPSDGTYGYAPDYPNQRAAIDSARIRCYVAKGKNCSAVISIAPNAWGAVYRGDKK